VRDVLSINRSRDLRSCDLKFYKRTYNKEYNKKYNKEYIINSLKKNKYISNIKEIKILISLNKII
jgi:hypothetical protein